MFCPVLSNVAIIHPVQRQCGRMATALGCQLYTTIVWPMPLQHLTPAMPDQHFYQGLGLLVPQCIHSGLKCGAEQDVIAQSDMSMFARWTLVSLLRKTGSNGGGGGCGGVLGCHLGQACRKGRA